MTMGLTFFKYISYRYLSYDVASGSEITLCIKIDKPLVVYRYIVKKPRTSTSTGVIGFNVYG